MVVGGIIMLSIEQSKIIIEQVHAENADEFVDRLIIAYASDIKRIGRLLSLIPKLAENQLEFSNKRTQEYCIACDLLISERYRYPISKRKNKKESYNPEFVSLFYVCKAKYPWGNCENGSVADRALFNEFIEMVKNKSGFDYEDQDDWNWVCRTAEAGEWMSDVIRQNIDPEFIGINAVRK